MTGLPQRIARFAGLALALLLASAPAPGIYGVIDEVPAATLLFPYFEVELDEQEPFRNTRITIVNADQSEVGLGLAHVTLWTDWGLPTASFTVFLPSGGSIVIDLGELFATASLPFPAFGDSCKGGSTEAPFSASALRSAHTGSSSDVFGGLCGSRVWGDSIARGFVTVDSVDDCVSDTPVDESYFSGIAAEYNVLIGHYVIEREQPFSALAAPAIHLEANSIAAGLETFYYRFGPINNTDDAREPLSVGTWSAGYTTDLSEVICWRDALFDNPIACDGNVLLGIVGLTIHDHAGNEDVSTFASMCNQATAAIPAGDIRLETVSKTGSFSVEINTTPAVVSGGFTPRRQSYLSAIHYLHPLGLGIHVPGTADSDSLVIPLFGAGAARASQ